MATRGWHSRGLPTWRIWLTPWSLAKHQELGLGELPFAGGLVLLLASSMLWRRFPMAVAGAGLFLILQQIADPSPLFLTVPWGSSGIRVEPQSASEPLLAPSNARSASRVWSHP